MQDIAVVGSLHDPQINTAECVISGHEKALPFSGLKQLLHGVCWSLLFISLVMSTFVSQAIVVQLGKWDKEQLKEQNLSKLAAVMVLSVFVFVVGFSLNIYAWYLSTRQQDLYVCVFLGFVLLVLFRRVIWRIYIHCRNNTTCTVCIFDCSLTSGHGEGTSNNFVSCFFVYPAVFMACHHLLWVLLGIITEPFWGITILVGVVAISAAFYLLVCEFHSAYFSQPHPSHKKPKMSLKFMIFIIDIILFLFAFMAFVLLLFVFLVIAQAFLSESLISTIVQNGLVTVVTLWLAYLKFDAGKGGGGGAETGGGGVGGGGGGGGSGGEGGAPEGASEGGVGRVERVAGEIGGAGGGGLNEEREQDINVQEHIHLMSMNHSS